MRRKALLNLLIVLISLCLLSGGALSQEKSTGKKAEPATKAQKSEPKTEKKTNLIDINSATKQELMTIPGIGDAYSQKIIEGRPYRAKNELVQKKIIPQATYDKIADSISAKRSRNVAKKRMCQP